MSNKLLKWLILLALVLLVVSLLSLWFTGPSFRDKDVGLEIEGPNQATVGDEVAYKLKYSNNTRLDLTDLRFTFFYPEESIVIKDGKVSSNFSEDFSLGKLSSGESGEKEFKMYIGGDRGDIKTAKANLSFKASGLKSVFEKKISLATTIVNVPVSLTLVAPPNVVSGQSIGYILDYRNESGDTISDLLFEFKYPEGFVPKEFLPQPEGGKVWRVQTIRKGAGGRITIQGTLSGQEGETKGVEVVLKRKIGDEYVDYEKSSSSSVINSPLLSLDVTVNDSKSYVANPGDDLKYTLNYSNNSKFTLSNMNLAVKLDGEMFDLSSLNTRGGFYDGSNRTIIWNSSNIGDFNQMTQNTKGKISFDIKIKNSDQLQGSNTLFVKASGKLSTPNIPENLEGNEVSAVASLVTNISIQPTVSQAVFYNDSTLTNTGPFPFKVGEETTLTVHWKIANPGNTLNQAKVTGNLFPGITWKSKFSAFPDPVPVYNRNSSEIIWDLGNLPQGIGGFIPKYELVFQIGVKPEEFQRDKPIDLIKNVKLSGVDSVTKQNIVVLTGDLNSNNISD